MLFFRNHYFSMNFEKIIYRFIKKGNFRESFSLNKKIIAG